MSDNYLEFHLHPQAGEQLGSFVGAQLNYNQTRPFETGSSNKSEHHCVMRPHSMNVGDWC